MFLYRAIIVVAMFALSSLASSQAQEQNAESRKNTTQPAQDNQPAKPNSAKPATTHFAPGFVTNEETYRAICHSPKDKDHADLCQQWRVAEAAVSQVVINAIGLLLLFGTLIGSAIAAIATYRMWQVNAHQRDIAEKSLKLSQTTLILSQRARVSVDPVGIETNTFDKLIGQVVFINSGNMPANDFKWRIKIAARGSGDWKAEEVKSSELEGGAVLPVGARWNMGSPACMPRPEMPTDYIYVYGRVEYADGFDEPRHTNFCHRYPWARNKTNVSKGAAGGQDSVETSIAVGYARFHKNGNEAN